MNKKEAIEYMEYLKKNRDQIVTDIKKFEKELSKYEANYFIRRDLRAAIVEIKSAFSYKFRIKLGNSFVGDTYYEELLKEHARCVLCKKFPRGDQTIITPTSHQAICSSHERELRDRVNFIEEVKV